MQFSFLRRWRGAVAAAALAGAVLAYATDTGPAAAAPPAQTAPAYSATQLADALLFQAGPVSGRLGGADRAAQLSKQQRSLEQAVHQSLARDPAWAASFAGRVQSGDRVQVQSALRELAGRYRTVLEQQFGNAAVKDALGKARQVFQARQAASAQADPYTATYQININYVVNYAAVDLAIEIAALIVVFVLVPAVSTGAAPQGAGNRLTEEAFVDHVAAGLATA
jgi:hypothetical protein